MQAATSSARSTSCTTSQKKDKSSNTSPYATVENIMASNAFVVAAKGVDQTLQKHLTTTVRQNKLVQQQQQQQQQPVATPPSRHYMTDDGPSSSSSKILEQTLDDNKFYKTTTNIRPNKFTKLHSYDACTASRRIAANITSKQQNHKNRIFNKYKLILNRTSAINYKTAKEFKKDHITKPTEDELTCIITQKQNNFYKKSQIFPPNYYCKINKNKTAEK